MKRREKRIKMRRVGMAAAYARLFIYFNQLDYFIYSSARETKVEEIK